MFQRAVMLCVLLSLASGVLASERPNILFCLADDWGWPHAGVYGDPVVQTPTFDRLAREGALFDRAYISSPSCTPSRNAMLTGQQFYRLDQGANLHSSLDPKHPNFMFLLRDAGYEIGHWRKAWGPGDHTALGYTEHPCGPGSTFNKFFNQRDKDKPFCFWFGTSDPHRKYKKGSGAESGMDLAKVPVPSFYPDVPEVRSDIADYYWEVQRWDSDVAAAIELLEQAGELDNTIIVMTGDHGMPFPRCKGNLYDWGSRVPLAVRWGKQIKPGQRFDEFVSLTDLAPTFLEAAGVEVPEEMTGRSLVSVTTTGEDDAERGYVVYGRERHTPAQKMPSMDGYPSRAIRTDRWLLIMNSEPDRWPAGVATGSTHPYDSLADCDAGPTKTFLVEHQNDPEYAPFYALSFAQRPPIELYDCQADPDQINNLANDPEHAETVAELRGKLVEYLQSTGDPRFSEGDAPFDGYPYRAKYLKAYLEKNGY
ncbi:sulfatase family protein [Aeoliella sp.]|uniref:sulfatase family protein n=1 Tax=Aeoliella sp. TaxID=2795800 RepID=UPI003CCB7563